MSRVTARYLIETALPGAVITLGPAVTFGFVVGQTLATESAQA